MSEHTPPVPAPARETKLSYVSDACRWADRFIAALGDTDPAALNLRAILNELDAFAGFDLRIMYLVGQYGDARAEAARAEDGESHEKVEALRTASREKIKEIHEVILLRDERARSTGTLPHHVGVVTSSAPSGEPVQREEMTEAEAEAIFAEAERHPPSPESVRRVKDGVLRRLGFAPSGEPASVEIQQDVVSHPAPSGEALPEWVQQDVDFARTLPKGRRDTADAALAYVADENDRLRAELARLQRERDGWERSYWQYAKAVANHEARDREEVEIEAFTDGLLCAVLYPASEDTPIGKIREMGPQVFQWFRSLKPSASTPAGDQHG